MMEEVKGKMSYENYEKSVEKWKQIVDCLAKMKAFKDSHPGMTTEELRGSTQIILFRNRMPRIVESCGFCEEFGGCLDCPLHYEKLCHSNGTVEPYSDWAFWRVVFAYRAMNIDLALENAEILLERIIAEPHEEE